MIDKKMIEPDLPELKEITDDGAIKLVEEIVKLAKRDYVTAIMKYNTAKGRGKKTEARHDIINCERFFRRDMHTYVYIDFDGEQVINSLRNQAQGMLEKKGIKMEVPKY